MLNKHVLHSIIPSEKYTVLISFFHPAVETWIEKFGRLTRIAEPPVELRRVFWTGFGVPNWKSRTRNLILNWIKTRVEVWQNDFSTTNQPGGHQINNCSYHCDILLIITVKKLKTCTVFQSKHKWKFARTRNAVATRAAGEYFHSFFGFSQTFTSVSITR